MQNFGCCLEKELRLIDFKELDKRVICSKNLVGKIKGAKKKTFEPTVFAIGSTVLAQDSHQKIEVKTDFE